MILTTRNYVSITKYTKIPYVRKFKHRINNVSIFDEKMKVEKNKKITMTQNRLAELAMFAIEQEACDSTNLKEITRDFAEKKYEESYFNFICFTLLE